MDIFYKNTLAVIVLYNEALNNCKTIQSLVAAIPSGKVLDLLVYDNSLENQNIDIDSLEQFNIRYIHDSTNPGVSVAYNIAARIAKEIGKEWILLLDQDTQFEQNILLEYYNSIIKFPDIKLFAPILKLKNGEFLSPCKFNYYGSHLNNICSGINSFKNISIVNSGILVYLDSFFSVGGYNANVKLDLSDHQFIEKFKLENDNFCVLESEGMQNFSSLEDDFEKQLVRFKYYCNGVLNFETKYYHKKLLMILFLFFKTLKKSYNFNTIKFFKILIGF